MTHFSDEQTERHGRQATQHRVLFVDDDPFMLESIKRATQGGFALTTAQGAAAGIAAITSSAPFTVVVSDLRMPGTDGIAFLAAVRRFHPDTVRILLTGASDRETGFAAVNEGQVFRFLRKPCSITDLRAALHAGMAHYDLVIAERALLEETLQGAISALVEVLAVTSPTSFARAVRVRDAIGPFVTRIDLPDRWHLEVATLLSQLGTATLPAELAQRMYHGHQLTDHERALVDGVEGAAMNVVAKIPRLEQVRDILASHRHDFCPPERSESALAGLDLPIGARVLRIAFDFDALLSQGVHVQDALMMLVRRGGCYDPELLKEFMSWQSDDVPVKAMRDVPVGELRKGMVLAADVSTDAGVLLMTHGQVVTDRILDLVQHYWFQDAMHTEVRVFVGDAK
ncbi:MAG: HD domain-containing phosphohydrolase [bacterium]